MYKRTFSINAFLFIGVPRFSLFFLYILRKYFSPWRFGLLARNPSFYPFLNWDPGEWICVHTVKTRFSPTALNLKQRACILSRQKQTQILALPRARFQALTSIHVSFFMWIYTKRFSKIFWWRVLTYQPRYLFSKNTVVSIWNIWAHNEPF